MLCISGMPHVASYIVDKMCALDMWHASYVYWLTKRVLVMNLLILCISSVAQVLNCITNPCETKNVATHQILSLYTQKTCACMYVCTCVWEV